MAIRIETGASQAGQLTLGSQLGGSAMRQDDGKAPVKGG